jgi:hypothetical protein
VTWKSLEVYQSQQQNPKAIEKIPEIQVKKEEKAVVFFQKI